MTHFAVADGLLDAQTLRAAGTAPYGGADVGECRATAAAVRGTDLASWHAAWTSTAGTVLALAQAEQAAGRLESARLAFFRASSYFRTAGVMLLGAPLDPRLADSYARQGSAFRSGAALLTPPPEIVQIPYEGTTLPGYFFRAGPDPAPRATVILTGGYDGTAEEPYFANGAGARRSLPGPGVRCRGRQHQRLRPAAGRGPDRQEGVHPLHGGGGRRRSLRGGRPDPLSRAVLRVAGPAAAPRGSGAAAVALLVTGPPGGS